MHAVQNAPSTSSFAGVAGPSRGGRLRSETATRTVTVAQQHGLHLRTCSAIVAALSRHQANVTIQKGSQLADATSVLDVLCLVATQGTELVLTATGPDAEEALEAVFGVVSGIRNDFWK